MKLWLSITTHQYRFAISGSLPLRTIKANDLKCSTSVRVAVYLGEPIFLIPIERFFDLSNLNSNQITQPAKDFEKNNCFLISAISSNTWIGVLIDAVSAPFISAVANNQVTYGEDNLLIAPLSTDVLNLMPKK